MDCSGKYKFKIAKKATYGKAGIYAMTQSEACIGSSGGDMGYGNTYKLTNPDGEGKTDSFVSSVFAKVEYNGVKYKFTENVEYEFTIGE